VLPVIDEFCRQQTSEIKLQVKTLLTWRGLVNCYICWSVTWNHSFDFQTSLRTDLQRDQLYKKMQALTVWKSVLFLKMPCSAGSQKCHINIHVKMCQCKVTQDCCRKDVWPSKTAFRKTWVLVEVSCLTSHVTPGPKLHLPGGGASFTVISISGST